jgi:hypothetical protein
MCECCRTHLFVKADKLKVTTTVTTLANHTLADAVQADKLESVKLAVLVLLAFLKLPKTLLKAGELAHEHIGLVHLVGHDDQLLLGSKRQN